MPNTAPSLDQLKKALVIAEQIQKLEVELASVLGADSNIKASAPVVKTRGGGKKRRTMSPEARARIVAAQKLRWAKIKAAKGGEKASAPAKAISAPAKAKAKPAAKAKAVRNISPEGRAKMAEAAKKRWAAKKAKA